MGVKITGSVSDIEAQTYVEFIEKKYNRKLASIHVEVDGDFVELDYKFVPMGMERIRRITGYLVGTMDNWNDAKAAEESDRVKHDISNLSLEK